MRKGGDSNLHIVVDEHCDVEHYRSKASIFPSLTLPQYICPLIAEHPTPCHGPFDSHNPRICLSGLGSVNGFHQSGSWVSLSPISLV